MTGALLGVAAGAVLAVHTGHGLVVVLVALVAAAIVGSVGQGEEPAPPPPVPTTSQTVTVVLGDHGAPYPRVSAWEPVAAEIVAPVARELEEARCRG